MTHRPKHFKDGYAYTLCNIPVNKLYSEDIVVRPIYVTCEDCLTIIEIKTRNAINYFQKGMPHVT